MVLYDYINTGENYIMKIVVLDDDKEIADLITLYLRNDGFDVKTFYCPIEAMEYLKNEKPDVLIMDIMMPKIDGLTLLKSIRKTQYYPVILVSSKDDDIDILNGLTLGGDGYITKPFNPLELVARVKATLRMKSKYEEIGKKANMFCYKDLILDYEKRKCSILGETIRLTHVEFEVLKLLAINKGKPLSSEFIFQEVTGDSYYIKACNSIATHIRNIRFKLNDSFEEPQYIKTLWGEGYVIEDDN